MALYIVHILSFFIIILRRNFMQLSMYPTYFMTQTRQYKFLNTQSQFKKLPPLTLYDKSFFSVFNRLGTTMHNNVFAWKWGSSNVISKAIQHATGDVMLVQNNVLKNSTIYFTRWADILWLHLIYKSFCTMPFSTYALYEISLYKKILRCTFHYKRPFHSSWYW